MKKIALIEPSGNVRELQLHIGSNVLKEALANGAKGLLGECGGACSCATCHCYVEEGLNSLPKPSALESDMLEFVSATRKENSRLACQLIVETTTEPLVIRIPDTQE